MSNQVVTDICNMGLGHLGLQPIGDIADTNKRALACQQFFNPSRDDVFSEHRWPFNTAIDTLRSVSYAYPNWNFAYAFPVNAARVWTVFGINQSLKVNPNDSSMQFVDNTMEEESIEFESLYVPTDNVRIIVTNQANAYCRYGYIVQDTTIWTPKFIIAFSYRLAAAMCHRLTGDAQKGLQLMQIFQGFNVEEKRVGATEQIKKPIQVSGYQKARG